METHSSKNTDTNILSGAFEIYKSLNDFTQKQFHMKHGKLCKIKVKQSKRKNKII